MVLPFIAIGGLIVLILIFKGKIGGLIK